MPILPLFFIPGKGKVLKNKKPRKYLIENDEDAFIRFEENFCAIRTDA